MARKQVVRDVDAHRVRCLHAYWCGFGMFRPDVELGEARRLAERGGWQYLSETEREARERLTPASWLASWSRGWNDAQEQQTGTGA